MDDDVVRSAVHLAMAHEDQLARTTETTGPVIEILEPPCTFSQVNCIELRNVSCAKKQPSIHKERNAPRSSVSRFHGNVSSSSEQTAQTSRLGAPDVVKKLVVPGEPSCSQEQAVSSRGKNGPPKVGSNWAALREQMVLSRPIRKRLRKVCLARRTMDKDKETKPSEASAEKSKIPSCSLFVRGAIRVGGNVKATKIVALDCEYVGVGVDGRDDALARASLVNSKGEILYDSFVRIERPVVDYRTHVSGVRPEDVTGPNAADPRVARAEIASLLRGRILVGHAVGNDLRVLRITHPQRDIRDTASYYKQLWRMNGRRGAAPPSLKLVVARILGVDVFQKNEHNSVEDARAALALYKKASKEWEAARQRKRKS